MTHTATTVNGQEYRAIEALGSELEELGYYDVDLQGEDYHGSYDVEGYVAHVIGEPVDCEVVSEEPVGNHHEDTRLLIVYGEALHPPVDRERVRETVASIRQGYPRSRHYEATSADHQVRLSFARDFKAHNERIQAVLRDPNASEEDKDRARTKRAYLLAQIREMKAVLNEGTFSVRPQPVFDRVAA